MRTVLDKLAKQSLSTLVGFMFGLAAVWWVKPTTTGGTIFIVFICVISSIIFGIVLRCLLIRIAQRNESTEKSRNIKKRELWLPGDD